MSVNEKFRSSLRRLERDGGIGPRTVLNISGLGAAGIFLVAGCTTSYPSAPSTTAETTTTRPTSSHPTTPTISCSQVRITNWDKLHKRINYAPVFQPSTIPNHVITESAQSYYELPDSAGTYALKGQTTTLAGSEIQLSYRDLPQGSRHLLLHVVLYAGQGISPGDLNSDNTILSTEAPMACPDRTVPIN